MQCHNCDSELPDTATFCINCGIDIDLRKARKSPDSRALCALCGSSFTVREMHDEDGRLLCDTCFEVEGRKGERKRKSQVMAPVDERRGSRRFEVSKGLLRVQKNRVTLFIRRSETSSHGPLADLSVHGLQGVVGVEMEEGEEITVELIIPAFKTPIKLNGVVRWVTPDGPGCRFGLQFVDVDETAGKKLKALQSYEALRNAGEDLGRQDG